MLSQRRIAQMGVGAASLLLVTCMTVLVAGGRDNIGPAGSTVTPVLSETHIASIAGQPVVTAQSTSQGQIASR